MTLLSGAQQTSGSVENQHSTSKSLALRPEDHDPKHDLLVLLDRLIEKMRRALSLKHLTDDQHGPQIADHQVVRGRMEWCSQRPRPASRYRRSRDRMGRVWPYVDEL
jgi:hypothetical protein